MDCSILISTYNRAPHLKETLESLAKVCVPAGISCEVVVIDNRSTDSTAEVVRSARLPHLSVRYLYEARPGKSHALNQAIAATTSDILLFTDDDLRFPANWIEGMCAPIRFGGAHGVAGGVNPAPHLLHPHVEPFCYDLLAGTAGLDPVTPAQMVGANMAVAREVFHRVPVFDPEIGPAGLGSGEEALFTWQLREAGYRIATAFDVVVEHHFEESRLLRTSFVKLADKAGRSEAYVSYHWQHYPLNKIHPRLLREQARYLTWRRRNADELRREYGISREEMGLLTRIANFRQWLIETKRPRNYEKRGLIKLRGER
jgi:glycosyltransferase involved in cell wall biosynthesis